MREDASPKISGMVTSSGKVIYAAKTPALCLDLDGTVRYSKSNPGGFIQGVDDVAVFSDVEPKLIEYRDKGFLIYGFSNQAGVAFGYKTADQVMAELEAMLTLLNGDYFAEVLQCYHHEDGTVQPYNMRSMLRKPNTGMLALAEVKAYEHGYLLDWPNSLFVGDREEDRDCAANAGIPFQWADEFFQRESYFVFSNGRATLCTRSSPPAPERGF